MTVPDLTLPVTDDALTQGYCAIYDNLLYAGMTTVRAGVEDAVPYIHRARAIQAEFDIPNMAYDAIFTEAAKDSGCWQ